MQEAVFLHQAFARDFYPCNFQIWQRPPWWPLSCQPLKNHLSLPFQSMPKLKPCLLKRPQTVRSRQEHRQPSSWPDPRPWEVCSAQLSLSSSQEISWRPRLILSCIGHHRQNRPDPAVRQELPLSNRDCRISRLCPEVPFSAAVWDQVWPIRPFWHPPFSWRVRQRLRFPPASPCCLSLCYWFLHL